jgi:hypothetical protein
VVIERPHKKCRVTIHAARPGLIIGKKGADIEASQKLMEMTVRDAPQHRRGAQRRKSTRRWWRRSPSNSSAVSPSPRHEARGASAMRLGTRHHQHGAVWAA